MEKVLEGKVRFLSRTDAGVSAFNNYALCKTKKHPFAANEIGDVWVTGAKEVNKKPQVYWRWYRYYYPEEVEVPRELLSLFVGRKDFSSFAITEGKNPVREIYHFSSFTIPGFTVFDVVGKSFLRQMVRRMVTGVILHLKGEVDVKDLLERPKERVVPPAPPEGLVLMNMALSEKVYPDREKLAFAKKQLENLWKHYKLRSLVLSNRWILG